MKQKLIRRLTIICIIMALFCTGVCADSSFGEGLSWNLDNGVLTISSKTGSAGIMPDYDTVTEGDGAPPWASEKEHITSLEISDGITSIGEYSFWNCESMTYARLPESLTSIGKAAFLYCSGLNTMTIPENVERIGDWAFVHCHSLRYIRIPQTTVEIGESVFEECYNLNDIYYGGTEEQWNAIQWGDEAQYLSGVNIHFEDYDLKSSGDCGQNLHWELDDGVLTISGTGDMIDFAGTEDIPWYNLNEFIIQVVVEQGVTSIGNNAFLECYLMEQVSLPEGLVRIGDTAFEVCTSLKKISLPASLQHIGEGAFVKCNASRISVAEGNTAYYSENNVLFDQSGTHLILYASNQDGTSYIIPDGVKYIETGAFFGALNLEQLTVSEGVYSIGEQAFQYSGLKEVYLPASLKDIGFWAFYGCDDLTDIWYNDLSNKWFKVKMADGDCTLARVKVHFADGDVGTGSVNLGSVVAEGRCGPDVYWQKDAYGTLRIYGNGSTYDFKLTGTYNVGDETFFPTWIFQDPAARRVIIESGVTRIGRGTFTDVPDIIKKTFHVALSDISDIYYTGTETQWQSFLENSSNSYNGLIENAMVFVNATVRSTEDQFEEEGWIQDDTGWWYQNADGTYPKACWQKIDGKWYHFDAKGYRQTGWLKISDIWYYFKADGVMTTGWLKIGSDYYYFNSNGSMAHDTWVGDYYLTSSGKMATDTWIDDKYVDSTGKYDPTKVKEGWVQNSTGWWYRYADGSYPKDQWAKIGGKWYHFDAKGYRQTGWLKISNTWYYFKADGVMATGWLKIGSDYYYFNSNGSMAHDTWVGDYYLLTGGKMARDTWIGDKYVDSTGKYDPTKVKEGWVQNSTGWWYRNADGTYPMRAWKKIDGKWYHFDDRGYRQTGWLKLNNTWYYLQTDGVMATGWLKIGSYYYYFNSNGSMAKDTWIGNYYVDVSGRWVKDAI